MDGVGSLMAGKFFYEKMWRTNRQHTVELVPAIQTTMEETG